MLSGILFSQKTLIRGAHIHVGNGNVIEKGLLGIDGDRIVLVKKELISSIDVKD